jgi:hypothetical protein
MAVSIWVGLWRRRSLLVVGLAGVATIRLLWMMHPSATPSKTFVSILGTNKRGQKKGGRQGEARTGTAAAGGKIVAAGDTPGRPGRAGNRTSLKVGTTDQ